MNLYREFRYTSGKSSKAWIVHAPRPAKATIASFSWAVTCKWGRIGNNLQGITKYFSTKSAAENFVSDKVSEKLAKGYKEYLKQPDIPIKPVSFVTPPPYAYTLVQAKGLAINAGSAVSLDQAFDKALATAVAPKCAHNNLTRQHNGWKCISCLETVEFEKKAACPVTQLEAVRYFNLEDL